MTNYQTPARRWLARIDPVSIGAVIALAALCVALAFAVGCHPTLPPVADCHVGAYACEGGRPVTCSSSLRWEPAGDRSCASVGAVCVVDDGGTAHCAPATDGGAE